MKIVCALRITYSSASTKTANSHIKDNNKLFELFINYIKLYNKQYPLLAVSRLASRGEQWLHVRYILQIAQKQD